MKRSGRGVFRWTGIVIAGLALGLAGWLIAAELTSPRPVDRQVTLMVADMLPREHLSRHPLDAEISKRMLGLFLRSLDPMKLYFYQADVDGFRAHEDELVAKVKRGDISPAYSIYALFLQRLEERVQMADEILKTAPDFTLDEYMVTDSEEATYATSPEDAKEKWRKRIKFDLLVLKSDRKEKIEGQAACDKLTRRYHSLLKRTKQTDAEELLEMYLTAMTSSYDPHTNYMSPSSVENFKMVMGLELEGIGAQLQFNDGYTVVNKLVPGGAAEKDGRLKIEDRIIGVGQGKDGEFVDVVDMKLNDVVKLIRGKRGTVVRLEVIAKKGDERKVIDITREKIELKDSAARAQVFEQGKRPDGQPYKLGVIDLPSFYMDMDGARAGLADFRSTTRDVQKILADFNAQNVDAVVLDLRKNGGGALPEAVKLSGLFFAGGPMVQVKGSDQRVIPYDDQDPSVAWAKPLVVVTSKLSASASEILAGAIQDYKRGLIVGDKSTHGKGTVQSLADLGEKLFKLPFNNSKLGSLKITVQQFYRPNGESTQVRGVLADVELPAITTHMDIAESDLKYAMPFDKIEPGRFTPVDLVTPEITAALTKKSAERVQASADFKKVDRSIARYLARKKDKKVTLNEKKFLAEREEFDDDKEEEKLMDETNKPAIERDFYMNEVLAVTEDYLNALGPKGK